MTFSHIIFNKFNPLLQCRVPIIRFEVKDVLFG